MKNIKYIGEITQNELLKNNVFLCMNEDGKYVILIKNAQIKHVPNIFKTDNLEIKLNTVLRHEDVNYYFHIITSISEDYYIKEQFDVLYEYIFGKIEEPMLDYELSELISSLEDYFKITTEKDSKSLQIGVYGELLSIIKIYELGCPWILKKYHGNFYSKHDIEISENIKIEIKTCTGDSRIHHFKHNQLHRDDCDIYIVSSKIEISQEGRSLLDLFEQVMSMDCDPERKFNLRKLIKRCGISKENEGIRVSYEQAYNNVLFIKGKSLPQLNCGEIPGVSNIAYDVDCALGEVLDWKFLINMVEG